MNIYLVSTAFNFVPFYLVGINQASVHFFLICLLLSNQKLVCTIHFQSLLVCLNPPKGILDRSKVEKQWHLLVASIRKSYKYNLKITMKIL